MLHTFTGADEHAAFWAAVTGQRGRIVSAGAASVVLRYSFEHLHRVIEGGDIEAWCFRKAEGGDPLHYMVSIPSLVRHGIRSGRFRSPQDQGLLSLNVTDGDFAALRAEAWGASGEAPVP